MINFYNKLKSFLFNLKIKIKEDTQLNDLFFKNILIHCGILLCGMFITLFWGDFVYVELFLFFIFIICNCKSYKIIYFSVFLVSFNLFFKDSKNFCDLSQYVYFLIDLILLIHYIYDIKYKKIKINYFFVTVYLVLFIFLTQPWKIQGMISYIELPLTLVLLFFAYEYRDEIKIKELLYVFVISLLGSCFIGLFQNVSSHMQILLPSYYTATGVERFHACGATNILACEINICIALMLSLDLQKKISCIHYFIIIPLQIALFATYSKLGIIVFFIQIVIYVVLYLIKHGKIDKKPMFLIALILGGSLLNIKVILSIFKRFTDDFTVNTNVMLLSFSEYYPNFLTKPLSVMNDLTTGRFEIWLTYFKNLVTSFSMFVFGRGAYSSNLVWSTYPISGMSPHNTFLFFLSNYGFLFVLLIILLIFAALKNKKVKLNYCGLLPIIVMCLCMLSEDFSYYKLGVFMVIALFSLRFEKTPPKTINQSNNIYNLSIKSGSCQNEPVSVIVPIYKVEKFLNNCIKSIVHQTYKNLEIILVDDGSPDTCPQICDKWAKKDNRIKVIHKQNGGLSDARNIGIKTATGQYLCFIDSDDVIDSNYVKFLYNSLKETNADIAICKYQKFCNEENIEKIVSNTFDVEVLDKNDLLNKLFEKNNIHFITACTKLYKKELFNKLEFNKGKLHEDEFIVHKIFDSCEKAVFVPLELYKYYERQGSITKSKKFVEKNLDAYYAVVSRYDYFKGTEFENKALNQLLNSIAYIYFTAKDRKADKNIVKFLKLKFNEYYKLNKNRTMKQFVFRYFTNCLSFCFKFKNILIKK